jgi:hypothetical protein
MRKSLPGLASAKPGFFVVGDSKWGGTVPIPRAIALIHANKMHMGVAAA